MNFNLLFKKAQATIELTLAIILMIAFFFGIIKIFIWGARSLASRHAYFEGSRLEMTNRPGGDGWEKEGWQYIYNANQLWDSNEAHKEVLKIFPEDQ